MSYTGEDRQYMIDALKQYRAIRVYRRTSGAARLANDLAVQGLVTMKVVQEDEQSSHLLVEWNADEPTKEGE